MKILVLDAEIKKLISGKDENGADIPKDPGYEYCDGWNDFAGMGISVVCVYNYADGRYHVFMSDNMHEIKFLIGESDWVVGFNSIKFDAKLLEASGIIIPPEKNFDVLVEMWKAAGIGDIYIRDKHHGYNLGDTVEANIDGAAKSGGGATATELWQDGKIGELIDYAINDVFVTKKLFDSILVQAGLWSPKDDGCWLPILPPQKRIQTGVICDNCGRWYDGPRCPKCGACKG